VLYKYGLTDREVLFLIEFKEGVKHLRLDSSMRELITTCRGLIQTGYMSATEESADERHLTPCLFQLSNQGILALAECVMYSDIDALYDNPYRLKCKERAAMMLYSHFGYRGLRMAFHHPNLSPNQKGARLIIYFDYRTQQFIGKTIDGEELCSVSIEEMRHYDMLRIMQFHTTASHRRTLKEELSLRPFFESDASSFSNN
jgi:hypothetical protein